MRSQTLEISQAFAMLDIDESAIGHPLWQFCVIDNALAIARARSNLESFRQGELTILKNGKKATITFSPRAIPETGKKLLVISTVESFTAPEKGSPFNQIIGDSPQTRRALEEASKAAQSSSTVLILGESGTGKELIARAIHNESPRKNEPFIAVNCGAFPRDLIQSELFGYEGGAFTGAQRNGRAGVFEQAHGGTLFLDEVGELPMNAQIALLRVLQDKTVTRVGGNRPRNVDARVIAATNRNLRSMIGTGEFREDLFYRLNVFPIMLAPLRERREDIRAIASHILAGCATFCQARQKASPAKPWICC